MLEPTEGQYLSALEVVKAYELNQEILLKEKADLVKVDLDEFFKTTEIKQYSILRKNWIGHRGIYIFPEVPFYDETYCGEYDEGLKKISEKHGILVKMDSSIYCK